MAEDTLTLNDGTLDVTFTKRSVDDSTVTWTASSPQSDFDGRYRLTRTATRSRTGILTKTVVLVRPRYISADGKYSGFRQDRFSQSGPSDDTTAEALKGALMLLSCFDTAVNADFQGNFVAGSDAD